MPNLSVPQSQYPAILQAIYTIATTGYTFARSKKGEVPSAEELQAPVAAGTAGYPFFSVRQGVWGGYVGDQGGRPDANFRAMQQLQQVWDFDCYVFWQYKDYTPNTPNPAPITHYDDAATVMVAMQQIFTENMTLNGTCSIGTVHSFGIQYTELNSQPLTTVRFTVSAYEEFTLTYS